MGIPALNDIPELSIAPESEYALRIIGAKDIQNKDKTRDGLLLTIQFVDRDNTHNMMHRLWYPNSDDDKSKQELMWRMVKEFCKSLGLDTTQDIPNEDFLNLEFNAIVTVREYQGVESNEIKKVL